MAIPLTNLIQRVVLVCSVDKAVTLKVLPETDAEIDARVKSGAPQPREARRPVRWLPLHDVEKAGADATRVTVRMLDADECFAIGASSALLSKESIANAWHEATRICILEVAGPGTDARTPAEVSAWRKTCPLLLLDAIGEFVVDESTGYKHPFDSTESG